MHAAWEGSSFNKLHANRILDLVSLSLYICLSLFNNHMIPNTARYYLLTTMFDAPKIIAWVRLIAKANMKGWLGPTLLKRREASGGNIKTPRLDPTKIIDIWVLLSPPLNLDDSQVNMLITKFYVKRKFHQIFCKASSKLNLDLRYNQLYDDFSVDLVKFLTIKTPMTQSTNLQISSWNLVSFKHNLQKPIWLPYLANWKLTAKPITAVPPRRAVWWVGPQASNPVHTGHNKRLEVRK